jgi:predicted nucleic acid-binding protein
VIQYLDASVLVALFTDEPVSAQAQVLLHDGEDIVLVSDFAAAEFASTIARDVRNGEIARNHAIAVFSNFDGWLAQSGEFVEMKAADIAMATAYIRRLDLNLRAPDAIHIAMTQRLGATLVTFDKKMAVAARSLGTSVAPA